MATFPQDPTFSDLGNIAQQAFKSSPRAYEKYLMSQNPESAARDVSGGGDGLELSDHWSF